MAENETRRGQVIAVCSAKGGVGRTLISVNLALALNKNNHNVCILDGDFQFGDVSLAMDLQPSFSLKDVMEEVHTMDQNSIRSYVTKHSSGVQVLTAPDRPEYAELVTSEGLLKVVEALRSHFDYIIVDTSTGINEQSVDVLDEADQILLITNLEMTALKSTKLMLETFGKLGYREKTVLIVNRHDMESLIKAEDVPEMIGHPHVFYLPNNFKLASQSLNIGIPFVLSQSKANLSKAFFKMAEEITIKHSSKKDSRKKTGFVSKLFSTKK